MQNKGISALEQFRARSLVTAPICFCIHDFKYCRAVLASSCSAESALTEASLFLETDTGYRLLKKCELGALVHRNEQKNLKAFFFILFCPINSACPCSAYIQISPKLQRVFNKASKKAIYASLLPYFESTPLSSGCKHSLKEGLKSKTKFQEIELNWANLLYLS